MAAATKTPDWRVRRRLDSWLGDPQCRATLDTAYGPLPPEPELWGDHTPPTQVGPPACGLPTQQPSLAQHPGFCRESGSPTPNLK